MQCLLDWEELLLARLRRIFLQLFLAMHAHEPFRKITSACGKICLDHRTVNGSKTSSQVRRDRGPNGVRSSLHILPERIRDSPESIGGSAISKIASIRWRRMRREWMNASIQLKLIWCARTNGSNQWRGMTCGRTYDWNQSSCTSRDRHACPGD